MQSIHGERKTKENKRINNEDATDLLLQQLGSECNPSPVDQVITVAL